ncbi:MAG: LTA synthase family protein [Bacteroidales bacterium]|nr:LTA synthase family protein [Clostridium sp.]MCM1202576.1 LTA synthase family protein [Bacteroidales bacterium]
MIRKKQDTVMLSVIFVLQAFFLMTMMQCVTFADAYVLGAWLQWENAYFLAYNFLCYLFFVLLCYILFRSVLLSCLIPGITTAVFSVANNMKWIGLNECITISDFAKLPEAAEVAGKAEFHAWSGTWICAGIGILSSMVWVYFDAVRLRKAPRQKKDVRIFGIFLLVCGILLLPFLFGEVKNSKIIKLSDEGTADKTGPLVYFLESVLTISAQKPYTAEEAKNAYARYVEEGIRIVEEGGSGNKANAAAAKEEYPNIIVIMSEAFYDVNRLEGVVTYSENPMAAFEEVKKDSSFGNAMVNIYGGSTHFSEFEFLTGWNTRGMASGFCPYKEYFQDKQPSFVGYLKKQGYYTMAVHPYNGVFWERYKAYPRMGFDKFIDRSQMTYTDMCGYISDDALTNEIIYRYEKNKDGGKPFFCFGVSVANHIAIINGEEKQNVPENIEVTFHGNETGYGENRQKWFGEYISGISKSGEALKKLTDYFKQTKEPTVILFFGDHAPSYALDILKAGKKEEILAYSTPYLIWDNMNLDKEQNGEMNVSFLSTYLLMKLGMPLPEQSYYNIALREEYPVETRYVVKDKNGRSYHDFDQEEKEVYSNRALDLKKQVNALLENPDRTETIWD